GGNPTGIVFNGTSFFNVTLNGNSAPARFIFVSEDGSISGWNPALNPNDQAHAIAIAVDNGTNLGSERAIYKGATLGVANGHNFLYVTNFHTGRVETYDENFRKRSEEHTSELQSLRHLVCRLLLEKKKKNSKTTSK